MSGPGGWEVTTIPYQVDPDGGGWQTLAAVEIGAGSSIELRTGFNVGNGSGSGIPTGNAYLQLHNGAAFEDWPGYYGKNLKPGRPLGGGMGQIPPDYKEWTVPFATAGVHRTRVRIEWVDGDHFSDELVVTAAAMHVGELDCLFDEDEFGVVFRVAGAGYRGILREPYQAALQVAGHRPTLTVESVCADLIPHESTINVDGRAETWILREKDPIDELTILRLELQG